MANIDLHFNGDRLPACFYFPFCVVCPRCEDSHPSAVAICYQFALYCYNLYSDSEVFNNGIRFSTQRHHCSKLRPLKITAVSDGMVGKTCMLTPIYTTKQFPTEYVPVPCKLKQFFILCKLKSINKQGNYNMQL